jgi:type I restriction enzyme, R subunit
MSVQSEAQLETELVTRLQGLGWAPVRLPDEAALYANLRTQIDAHNGITMTDAEFTRVLNHLDKGGVFDRAETLRGKFRLDRDVGDPVWIEFLNTEHWCRNRYQVATQIGIEGQRKNRYDVTLLINGLPLCQVELKRRGVELKAAFHQINRYQRDSFRAARGLFQYVQVFVISNGVNTRYYANNRHQSFKQTFTWATPDNAPMNRLGDFADAFLEKCHLSKMISKYVVLHQSDKILMVLRSYQYYAAERIQERVEQGRKNGYIWHTTGSGKTLTSFKAAQNLIALPKVDKVVFVVDRADLDYQTTKEFNHFQPGSVDGTDNTRQLVTQLADPNTKLVITTIQKLNTAISRDLYGPRLEHLKRGRVVFIFDECHRSQFGDTHRRIRAFFERCQMFGFTGTPILEQNAIGRRTTKDLFDERLHDYVITDAIRDENVLRFSVEYHGPINAPLIPTGDHKADRKAQAERNRLLDSRAFYDHPDRIDRIADWIIENHDRKTRGRQFGAIFAVSSVDALCAYYEVLEAKRRAGAHDLKIATIFTYAANEEDPDADGLIPDTEFPADGVGADNPKRDKLMGYVDAYNALYGVNESVRDGKGFYSYYRALAKRMKARDRKDFTPDQGIDILLVVNMFLTGFDAKTLNTLYVDKNLRYHGLIQAFSRTNRTLGQVKSQGNIVCFRDLKENTDEAITLFANRDASEVVLIGSYEEHLAQYEEALRALHAITPTPDDVDNLKDEQEQAAFAKAFRELMRIRNVLSTFSEFDVADLASDPQEYEDFKSKYLDLSQRGQKGDGEGGGDEDPLAGIDFELELLRRDEINVSYILALLLALKTTEETEGRASQKAQTQRQRVVDLIASEIGLRNKRPYLEEFLNRIMPNLPPDADLRKEFDSFWAGKRAGAFAEFCAAEKLDPGGLQKLIAETLFTGKRPLQDRVLSIMIEKPGILRRRSAVERVIDGMERIVETFDEGVDEMETVEL